MTEKAQTFDNRIARNLGDPAMRNEVTIYCAVCANAVENCCCHMPVVRSRQPAQPVAVNTVQDAARWQEVALKIWRIANSTDPEDPEFTDALRAIAEGRA